MAQKYLATQSAHFCVSRAEEERRVKGAKTKNQRAVQLEFMSVLSDPAVITNYQNYQTSDQMTYGDYQLTTTLHMCVYIWVFVCMCAL